MRNVFLGLVLVWLTCASGCSVDAQFVDAVDASWQVIGPRYCEYVRADQTLDEDSKTTRLRTAQLLSETIAEAQK